MITNKGKDIFGKYLVGTAPAYASYIAVGCGAQPNPEGYTVTSADKNASTGWPAKNALDFEMFRVPIISRGFIEDDLGRAQVVFSAEIPTTERYEITEVGIYSAASNPSAVGYDSRTLYAFTREEQWKFDEALLQTIDSPLDDMDSSNDITIENRAYPVIQTYATNRLFRNLRIERSEQSRYLNNMIMLSGDFSDLSGATMDDTTISGKSKISLATSLDLSKNSPLDELRLAISVVDVDGTSGVAPYSARVVVEFTTNDDSGASFRINFDTPSGDLTGNRYTVITRNLGDGEVVRKIVNGQPVGEFLWSAVNNVNVYASVVDSSGNPIVEDINGTDYPLYYLALDALRLENTSSQNPLYGLTGYTIIENTENGINRPIVKLPNTSAMIEFRLGVGVYNG
jgi:hypothetical protein